MKKMIILGVAILGLMFVGCDTSPATGGEDPIDPVSENPYQLDGTVEVSSSELIGNESFGAQMIGNISGTFSPVARSARAIAGNAIITIPDILKRYTDVDFVEKKSYTFSSFKLVADVILKPDHYFTGYTSANTNLLTWGGDGSDISQYIDLVSGEFESTTQPNALFKTVYNSVLLQINAPAATLTPDFGSDIYGQSVFSWSDLKPFYSTTSTAQNIVYSTFVTEPFVKWIGVKSAGFDNLITVQDFFTRSGHHLTDFGDWAFNAPLNQEFFDEIAALNLTEDPHSGEAWVFMPLKSAIDLTSIDKVTFSFEFYMKHLMEVFKDSNGDPYYMLGSSKNFKNSAGDYFYGPLPIRISYKSNINGFTVDPVG